MIENYFQSEYFNWRLFFSGFKIQSDLNLSGIGVFFYRKIRFEVICYNGISMDETQR